MGLYVRTNKFGVVEANHLLTGGYNRVSVMGEKEIRVKLVSGDYVWYIKDGAVEKVIEAARSTERVYHGQAVMDENNPVVIPFKVFTAATSVKLKLWGINFPSYHYTELPAHNHGAQAFASTAHTHTFSATANTGSGGNHNHPFYGVRSSTEGTDATHRHVYARGDIWSQWTDYTNPNHDHYYTPSGSVGNDGVHDHPVSIGGTTGAPSVTTAIPSQGIGGYTLNDTAKTLVDTLIQLYITAVQGTWGTAKDKNTTTPVNFSTLANINNNGGTAEFDIFPYVTAGAFNYIKVHEPTAKKGGTILWHISVS